MKFLSRLLMLGICFELLVAPIKPELAVVTVLRANADASTCGPGTSWSDAANRCLVNASTAQTQRDLQECANKTEAELAKCLEQNARTTSGNQTVANVQDLYKVDGQMKGIGLAKTVAYAAPLILFTYLLINSKKENKGRRCMPPSTIALIAGAVASGAGEVYGYIKHEDNMDTLNEKRAEISKGKPSEGNSDQQKINITTLQSDAFQLLADEQKSVAQLAKAKSTFYSVAALAYAAAAGLAIYELVTLNSAKELMIKTGKAQVEIAAPAAESTSSAAALPTAATLKAAGAALANAKSATAKAIKDLDRISQENLEGYSKKESGNTIEKRRAAEAAIEISKEAEKVAQETYDKALAANKVAADAATATQNAMAATAKAATEKAELANNAAKSAKKNYEILQQKYVCAAEADPEIRRGKKIKRTNPRDLIDSPIQKQSPLTPGDGYVLTPNPSREFIKTQISKIKEANSIEEVHLLAEKISGNGFQTYNPSQEELNKLSIRKNDIFVHLYAGIVAQELEHDYQLIEDQEKTFFENIVEKVKNNILIPKSYAQKKDSKIKDLATSLVPIVGAAAVSTGKKDDTKDANATKGTNQTEAAEETSPIAKHKSKTDEYLHSPKFRIAFGGVLSGLSIFMALDMKQLRKTAESREEKLLTLKKDFENTQGMKICTPEERNNQAQPGCYCYTAEGSRNTNRANSAICQNMWSSVSMNGTSYLSSNNDEIKVCITQSQAIDESCSCRSTNTCMKASGFNISGISLGTLSSLSSGLNPINTLSSGNGATLNSDANINAAMKLREATKKLTSAPTLKGEVKGIEVAEKRLGDFIHTNQGSIQAPASRSTPSSLAGFDAKAALEDLKKEVESSKTIGSNPAESYGIDIQSSEPTLEFGLTEEEAAVQEQQVAEVLQQDMDLGSNDISGSSTNLFEVLSHRYQRSGMRRLFDTEGKTEADKPAETDINK